MELRDLADMVVAYFTSEKPTEILKILADAVEEAGGDSTPLRVPGWPLLVYDFDSTDVDRLAYFTVAERTAYENGSADGDPSSETNALYYDEETLRAERPDAFDDDDDDDDGITDDAVDDVQNVLARGDEAEYCGVTIRSTAGGYTITGNDIYVDVRSAMVAALEMQGEDSNDDDSDDDDDDDELSRVLEELEDTGETDYAGVTIRGPAGGQYTITGQDRYDTVKGAMDAAIVMQKKAGRCETCDGEGTVDIPGMGDVRCTMCRGSGEKYKP